MKHQNPYKTAAELKIEEWERDGLIALIGPLSRNELELHMGVIHICDTVGCIGGWVAFKAGRPAAPYVRLTCSSALRPLYYPDESSGAGWSANAPQAAAAIVNFLTTSAPRWDDVMAAAS